MKQVSVKLLCGVSLLTFGLTALPLSVDPGGTVHWQAAVAKSGSSCFIAGTMVRMADGGTKAIETIRPGDRVLGRDGQINTVTAIERPKLGARKLYGFNGSKAFVTAEHPFLGVGDEWLAIDPLATAEENPRLDVKRLQRGDEIAVFSIAAVQDGNVLKQVTVLRFLTIDEITEKPAPPDMVVYNLLLDGDHTYFADDYLVHNKGGDGDGDGDGGSGGGGDDGSGGGSGGDGDSDGDDGDDGGNSGPGGGGDSDGDDGDDDGGNSGPGGGSDGDDGDDDGGSSNSGPGSGNSDDDDSDDDDSGDDDDSDDNDEDNSGSSSSNSGPGSANSGRGSSNSGRGSANSGKGSANSGSSNNAGDDGSIGSVSQSDEDLTPDEEAAAISSGWD
jgi:hypothetical protein